MTAHLSGILTQGPGYTKDVGVASARLKEDLHGIGVTHSSSCCNPAVQCLICSCMHVLTFHSSVHFSEGQVTWPTGPSFSRSVLSVCHDKYNASHADI